jgi:hypothetical protein
MAWVYLLRQELKRKRADIDRIVSVHGLIKRKADMLAKTRAAGTALPSMPADDTHAHLVKLKALVAMVRGDHRH